jgi:hypothetical protein
MSMTVSPMNMTVQKTIDAIVSRSSGVRWLAGSKGLALIREREGYILVAELKPGDDILGERLGACRAGTVTRWQTVMRDAAGAQRAIKHILGFWPADRANRTFPSIAWRIFRPKVDLSSIAKLDRSAGILQNPSQ